ncbi:MAG: putative site-specific methylase [Mucilaginibacter sp.]|nr:putative site-specific methylase [Mucilaginibacter sp.]
MEIEAFIIANLVGQMEAGLLDSAPIWTNVKTFDARPFRNKIHGIIGGYPCQPFSLAGERHGIEDERHLFPYILEQIKIIGPDWVFFENVGGHLSMGYGEVRRSISNLGYRVEEGIFTAEEVGAPHRRERLFIFGIMENAGILGRGGRYFGDTKRSECESEVKGSGTSLEQRVIDVADTSNEGLSITGFTGKFELSKESGEGLDSRLEFSSNSMAYTYINDSGTNIGYVSAEKGEGDPEENKRERNRDEFGTCNSILDNSFQSILEGHPGNDGRKERWKGQERSTSEASLFPAGQGSFQYEWEEPRTIESRMVYTIDGYNFTEDLHRAIGNSVVEQTAELAFITLLEKHIKNGA